MKNFKLVNSRKVQEKAFRLNFKWSGNDKKVSNLHDPYLYIEDRLITSSGDCEFFSNHDYKEITQTDFLALPEPLKVGDWAIAKYKDSYETFVAKIHDINNWQITLYQINGEYKSEELKKLTPEQIEVLGLE
ncbi:MAG: hypothetical protein GY777_13795 [Candidatus Brocadiaceae bacterium]|nr:hypothetical protein [Candidatus Brocadiaceae bacterium]